MLNHIKGKLLRCDKKCEMYRISFRDMSHLKLRHDKDETRVKISAFSFFFITNFVNFVNFCKLKKFGKISKAAYTSYSFQACQIF